MGFYARVKTWTSEVLTSAALNAEFDNIINHANPSGMAGASSSVGNMQATTDPGGVGTESLASDLLGELKRLRFAIGRLAGGAQWYVAPITTFGAGGVVTASLADGAVTRAKLADAKIYYVAKTGDYTASSTTNDLIYVDATSANVTISLPAATSKAGVRFIIKKSDSSANKVIIDPDGAELIEGVATFSLFNQYDSVEVICNGAGWLVVNSYIKKERALFKGTTFTAGAAGTVQTLGTSSDSTRYPLSSNTFTIRKTAIYRLTISSDITGNGDNINLGYNVNGGTVVYGTQMTQDLNASGSFSYKQDTFYVSLTAGDTINGYVKVSNSRSAYANTFELIEL